MAEIEAMGSSGRRLQKQYHQLARIVKAYAREANEVARFTGHLHGHSGL